MKQGRDARGKKNQDYSPQRRHMPLGKRKAASRKQSPGTAMSQQKNKRYTRNTHMAWKAHAFTCPWGKPVKAAAATNYNNTWAITEWNQLNLPPLQPLPKVRGSTSRQRNLNTSRQLYICLKGCTGGISIRHRKNEKQLQTQTSGAILYAHICFLQGRPEN